MIQELLSQFLNNWYTQREHIKNQATSSYSNNKFAKILLYDLPKLLNDSLSLHDNNYSIKGSVGQTNLSYVPWIGIYDNEITTGAQEGYYIVLLFKEDMTGFYLSLNQGWTQFKKRYSRPLAKHHIHKSAIRLKYKLSLTETIDYRKIDLASKGDLAVGYELGNIHSKYYSTNNVPSDDILLKELKHFLHLYKKLKRQKVNLFDFNIVNNDDDQYQSAIQDGKKPSKKSRNSLSWPRDIKIAKEALKKAKHKCEFNPLHKTFNTPKSRYQFAEAHHFIPMKFQEEFEHTLDIVENIISLCPNCHRAFHNSTNAIKTEYINNFLPKRQDALKEKGIIITEEQLLNYYIK